MKKFLCLLLSLSALSFVAGCGGSSSRKPCEHQYKLVRTIEHTCISDGYSIYECTKCHSRIDDDPVSASQDGHNYNNYVCTYCDDFLADEAVVSEHLRYKKAADKDGNYIYAVVGVDEEFDAEYLKIPAIYQDTPVVEIANKAFYNILSIKHVIIPDTVKTIGKEAFNACMSLKSIDIPDSVTSIGESAFTNCYDLKEIHIPNIEIINEDTFGNCGFTEIKIPEGVQSIGAYSFDLCLELTSVTIPSTVTYIYHAAFRNCKNLTDIYYNGTKQQWWTSIVKEDGPFTNWDDGSWDAHTGNYAVHCTDGDIKPI